MRPLGTPKTRVTSPGKLSEVNERASMMGKRLDETKPVPRIDHADSLTQLGTVAVDQQAMRSSAVHVFRRLSRLRSQ